MVGKITIVVPVQNQSETDSIANKIENVLDSIIGDDWGMTYKTISEQEDLSETERALKRKQ
jgi:hypothetical protein